MPRQYFPVMNQSTVTIGNIKIMFLGPIDDRRQGHFLSILFLKLPLKKTVVVTIDRNGFVLDHLFVFGELPDKVGFDLWINLTGRDTSAVLYRKLFGITPILPQKHKKSCL